MAMYGLDIVASRNFVICTNENIDRFKFGGYPQDSQTIKLKSQSGYTVCKKVKWTGEQYVLVCQVSTMIHTINTVSNNLRVIGNF